jgi:hypothetical protein
LLLLSVVAAVVVIEMSQNQVAKVVQVVEDLKADPVAMVLALKATLEVLA